MKLALLLTAIALLAPAQRPKLEFEVATVKPSDPASNGTYVNSGDGKLECKNITLKQLIVIGYHVRKEQVGGGPAWLDSAHFDIAAKYEMPPPPPTKQPLTDAQRLEIQSQFEERVRSLLEDRFQTSVKMETRDLSIYALVVAKGGPKLQPEKDTSGEHQGTRSHRGSMSGTSSEMGDLANALGYPCNRPVIDKTGIKGRFDYQLDWTPDPPPGTTPADVSGPSIFTAVQEQLGLKLESQKVALPFVVIERAEKPSPN